MVASFRRPTMAVTQNPPASTMTTLAAFSPAALLYSLARKDGTHNEIYYHVGVKLKLFGEEEAPPSPFKISYSRVRISSS